MPFGTSPQVFLGEEASRRVEAYYSGSYTGAWFDRLPPGDPNRFEAVDVVAVGMLSVQIPPWAAIDILDKQATALSDLLAEIPRDTDLWAAPEAAVADGSEADRLWHALTKIDDIGWVTANKLLARKRPRLLPVYDDVVRAALRPPAGSFWRTLREFVSDSEVRDRLDAIRRDAGVGPEIPLLRILDVCVWMGARGEPDSTSP